VKNNTAHVIKIRTSKRRSFGQDLVSDERSYLDISGKSESNIGQRNKLSGSDLYDMRCICSPEESEFLKNIYFLCPCIYQYDNKQDSFKNAPTMCKKNTHFVNHKVYRHIIFILSMDQPKSTIEFLCRRIFEATLKARNQGITFFSSNVVDDKSCREFEVWWINFLEMGYKMH
jgi:hypothetical protein